MVRPRRSLLYVPGANARALDKAATLAVDGVILDLEDSVAPEMKEAARRSVAAAVAGRGFGRREVIVRINGLDTHEWLDDIAMVAKTQPDGVLVPKITAPRAIEAIADRLNDIHGARAIRIWAMIETPVAVLHIDRIAEAAADREMRMAGFVLGLNDLARETRVPMTADRAAFVPWLAQCVLAGRAYGLDIIDGVYNDFADAEGFARECAQGRSLGFDGKTLIHPSQIAPANAAFTPPEDEVRHAREVIAAFADPANAGRGVIPIAGRMVERLHLDMARRTVALTEAIAARTTE